MTNEQNKELLAELIELAAKQRVLKRAVFSKPSDPEIKRATLALKEISGRAVLQLESFIMTTRQSIKTLRWATWSHSAR